MTTTGTSLPEISTSTNDHRHLPPGFIPGPSLFRILVLTFLIKVFIPTDVVSMMYMGQISEADLKEAADIIRARFHLGSVHAGTILLLCFRSFTRRPGRVRKDTPAGHRMQSGTGISIPSNWLLPAWLSGLFWGWGPGSSRPTTKIPGSTRGHDGQPDRFIDSGVLLRDPADHGLRGQAALGAGIGDGGWKQLILPAFNLGLILVRQPEPHHPIQHAGGAGARLHQDRPSQRLDRTIGHFQARTPERVCCRW